jgi:hypothetical protein
MLKGLVSIRSKVGMPSQDEKNKGRGENSFDSYSLRSGNILMKIKLYMRLDIFNAQTNFQFYIYKNVGVASKKPILIVKFIKGALDKRCHKIQLLYIHLGLGFFLNFFTVPCLL